MEVSAGYLGDRIVILYASTSDVSRNDCGWRNDKADHQHHHRRVSKPHHPSPRGSMRMKAALAVFPDTAPQ